LINIINTLILFNERLKAPYVIGSHGYRAEGVSILNDMDEIDPYKTHKGATGKFKLWTKEQDDIGMENYFKEYIGKATTLDEIYIGYYVFESVFNTFVKRKENKNKKKDDSYDDDSNNIIPTRKRNVSEFLVEVDDEFVGDVVLDHSSSRTKRLLQRNEEKKKDSFLDVFCYKCNMVARQGSKQVVCDSCSQIAHLTCTGLKVKYPLTI
jgi:hypothetical protein